MKADWLANDVQKIPFLVEISNFEVQKEVHRGFKYVKYGMFGIKWCI